MEKSNLTIGKKADLSLTQRVLSPTPSFFRKVRTVGVVMGLVGAALLASPVTLPALVVTIGGYLALAGGIITSVAQTAKEGE
jgi:hypothetical protein